jgi:hypothetical protein
MIRFGQVFFAPDGGSGGAAGAGAAGAGAPAGAGAGQGQGAAGAGGAAAAGSGQGTAPAANFYVKEDGTYIPNFWEHPKFPAELKDNLQIRTHKTLADTFQNWGTLEKIRGHHVVPVPAAGSDDTTWGQVADRLGRPPSAKEYKVPTPEAMGIKPEQALPGAAVDLLLQDMHACEFTQRQVERWLPKFNQRIVELNAAQDRAAAAAKEEALKPLRAVWGAEFDANRQKVEQFLRARVPAAELSRVLALGLLDEPGLLAALHPLAVQLGEKGPDLTNPRPAANVLAEAQTEVKKLKAHPAYTQPFHAEHKIVVDKVNELQKMLFDAQGAAGSNRTV